METHYCWIRKVEWNTAVKSKIQDILLLKYGIQKILRKHARRHKRSILKTVLHVLDIIYLTAQRLMGAMTLGKGT